MKVEDYSSKSFGVEDRVVDIRRDESAIISIDTWNNCYGSEPFYPERGFFWELNYIGSCEMAQRIKEVIDDRVAPLLGVARRHGVQIIHSMPGYIANRDCWLSSTRSSRSASPH